MSAVNKWIFRGGFGAFLCSMLVLANPVSAQPKTCVTANGRVFYTDGYTNAKCPASTTERRPTEGEGSVRYPELPLGLWKLQIETDGVRREGEVCGSPIEGLVHSFEFARSRGCKVQITSPAEASTKVVVECAEGTRNSTRSGALMHRRVDVSFTVTSPQAMRYEGTNDTGSRVSGEATRVGDCK
jgi:hypothetical protein